MQAEGEMLKMLSYACSFIKGTTNHTLNKWEFFFLPTFCVKCITKLKEVKSVWESCPDKKSLAVKRFWKNSKGS